jgi:hypothetical protein
VSSGGNRVEVWKLLTSPGAKLTPVTGSVPITTGQFGGFFTSVSSNGNSNPIIWALSRPVSKSQASILLYAFNPEAGGRTMTTLFHAAAGLWPHQGGDSNQVPMIANGKVYVASNKSLRIFGLKAAVAKNQPK